AGKTAALRNDAISLRRHYLTSLVAVKSRGMRRRGEWNESESLLATYMCSGVPTRGAGGRVQMRAIATGVADGRGGSRPLLVVWVKRSTCTAGQEHGYHVHVHGPAPHSNLCVASVREAHITPPPSGPR